MQIRRYSKESRVITSYLVGESYDKVTQGILVNLNWFRDNELNKYPAQVVEEIWNYPSLKKDKPNYFIKFINVNLYSFKEMRYNEVKEKDKVWKLFTIRKWEELEQLVKEESMLKNYRNKLQRLSRDKEYCRMIWDERIEENLRKREDYIMGVDDGINQGIEQNRVRMIINLYNNHVSLDIISKSSGLTIEEIKNIINSNNNNEKI